MIGSPTPTLLTNKNQNKKKSIFSDRTLSFSLAFLLLFSLGSYAFATTGPFAPGAQIDPGCSPTDASCYVSIVSPSTAGGVIFTSSTGTLTQDNSSLFFDDTNNRLGVGTATPAATLDIENATNQMRIGDSASTYLNFNVIAGLTDIDYNTANGTDNAIIRFFRHTSTSGTMALDITAGSSGSVVRISSNSSSWFNGGNVGIGNSSPSAKLHVLATTEQLRLGYDASNYWSSTVGSNGALTLAGTGTGGSLTLTPTAGQNLNINLSTTGDFAVNTNQLYVDTSSGNVGIGTDTPILGKLQVSGGSYYNSIVSSSSDSLGPGVAISNTGTGGRSYVLISTGSSATPGAGYFGVYDTTDNAYRITVAPTTGNVGIGATPSAKLHVLATTEQLRLGYDTSNYYSTTVGSAGAVVLDAVGSSAAFNFSDNISTTGHIGLNTTSYASWGSGFNTIQGANSINSLVLTGSTGNGLGLSENGYYNGSAWTYVSTAAVANYAQSSGTHLFRTASSGTAGNPITWTNAMYISNTGNIGLGTTSPNKIGSGLALTLEGSALTNLEFSNTNASLGGTSDVGLISFWTATAGARVAQIYVSSGGASGAGDLQFSTKPSGSALATRMVIDRDGNVGIGVATSISARTHILSTTEQLRVAYDTSNYYSTTVGSTGGVTFNAVGSGSAFTFADPTTVQGALTQSYNGNVLLMSNAASGNYYENILDVEGASGGYAAAYRIRLGYNGSAGTNTAAVFANFGTTNEAVTFLGNFAGIQNGVGAQNARLYVKGIKTSGNETSQDFGIMSLTNGANGYTKAAGKTFYGLYMGLGDATNSTIINTSLNVGAGIGYQFNPSGGGYGTDLLLSPSNESGVITEVMRLQGKSGHVGIGLDNPSYRFDVFNDVASSYVANFFNDGNNANRSGIRVQAGLDDHTATGPSTLVGLFDGDGGAVGSITFGSSAVAYNTTSDERLKENIVDTALSIDTLMQIKIRDYTWKADGQHKLAHGVIAQELYQVYPGAVTVPADDTGWWMVDYSKLTPLVIKAVQDLDFKIQTLSSLEVEKDGSIASLIRAYLENSTNGLRKIFVGEVHTDTLCVGNTCLTESQVQQLLNQQNNSSSSNNPPAGSAPPADTGSGQTGDSAGDSTDSGVTDSSADVENTTPPSTDSGLTTGSGDTTPQDGSTDTGTDTSTN